MRHLELDLTAHHDLARAALRRRDIDAYTDILLRMRERKSGFLADLFESVREGGCARIISAERVSLVHYLHPSTKEKGALQLSTFTGYPEEPFGHLTATNAEQLMDHVPGHRFSAIVAGTADRKPPSPCGLEAALSRAHESRMADAEHQIHETTAERSR